MDPKIVFEEFWQLIKTLNESKEFIFVPISRILGITPLQLRVLVEVDQHDDLSLSELAAALEMNIGNASTLCKKMEQQKLMLRTRRPDDERFIAITLTHDGVCLLGEMKKQLNDRYFPILAEVSDETYKEIQVGLKALNDVVTLLNTQHGKDDCNG